MNRRKQVLGVVLVICWIATFAIGYNAFIGQDELLTVSLIGEFPAWLNIIIALAVFTIPAISISIRNGTRIFIVEILLFLLFVLLDVNRLTPYFIFYLAIFGLLIFFKKDDNTVLQCLLITASGIYMASGLHKINPGFSDQVLEFIWFHSLPIEPSPTAGYVIAISESLLGLGLLFKYTRKVSCVVLILTHLLLLWKLGPFKLNWNLIVWPWNFCMIAILIVLYFYETSAISFFKSLQRKHVVTILFFWIVPCASFFYLVPDNFGFKLYSGRTLTLDLKFESKIPELEAHNRSTDSLLTQINLQTYAVRTRQLAISPEQWIFERIQKNFEAHYKTETSLIPYLKTRPDETHKPE